MEDRCSSEVNDLRDNIVDETDDRNQYVTFVVGDEVFAVEMSPVQEIIRVPETVHVPLAPPALEGLTNLRGRVLPIISLRRVFGFEDIQKDDACRAVVINMGQPIGFVVDRVASVVSADPSQIEDIKGISSAVDTELLSGLIKGVSGYEMIMVLDFKRLMEQEFSEIEALVNATPIVRNGNDSKNEKGDEELNDELHLVSFEVAQQEYAFTIESIQEIVQVPENIVHVPRSASHLVGIITLRDHLLPVISLRGLFHMPPQEINEKNRIVVVTMGSVSVGLLVDGVNEVLRVPRAVVEPVPAILTQDGQMSDISEICRLQEGKRMVCIISARNLFQNSAIKEALTAMETIKKDDMDYSADSEYENEDDEQMVVFKLDNEEFGVSIESVQEIVRVPDELTHVPRAPSFVEGVINLRGTVLPVIDLRKRLGLSEVERNDRQRIVVFLIKGVQTGFIVDSVTEVLKISKESIEPAPRLSDEQAQLLQHIANLQGDDRIIQIIEPSHIIEESELRDISSITVEEAA
ncbi:MAG TPA: chemotaxis protein CheW [Nitrospirae bacterium]|nr:chemotaxis protein CheW [Nitrospirota bacterium]